MRMSRKGFTLLEVVITSVILFIVAVAIYLVLFNASATYTNETRLGDIQDRARRVTDEIVKELRAADTTSRLSLNKNTTSNTLSFRIPKRVDTTTGAIIWSDMDETALVASNPAVAQIYAKSVYPARPFVICYRYATSTLNADNNVSTTEGRILRSLWIPGTTNNVTGTVTRTISDYVKPPAAGDDVFQRGNDDTITINLTFLTVDNRNKILERNVRTSVSVRNRS